MKAVSRAQARARKVLQDSMAEVARRLGAATDDLLDLPDEDLAVALAEPDEDDARAAPDGAGAGGDSEEGFAARAALLRADRLALLAGDAAAGDGVRQGLDRLLQARRAWFRVTEVGLRLALAWAWTSCCRCAAPGDA